MVVVIVHCVGGSESGGGNRSGRSAAQSRTGREGIIVGVGVSVGMRVRVRVRV